VFRTSTPPAHTTHHTQVVRLARMPLADAAAIALPITREAATDNRPGQLYSTSARQL
jgi:hypothetical protein